MISFKISPCCGILESGDRWVGVKLLNDSGYPFNAAFAVNCRRTAQQTSTRLQHIVSQYHPGSGPRRGESGTQARWACSDNQHIAIVIAVSEAPDRNRIGGISKSGNLSDKRLKQVPVWPHECFVIESSGNNRRQ